MSQYAKILSINVLCGNDYTLHGVFVDQLKTNYQDLLGFINPVTKDSVDDEGGYVIKIISHNDFIADSTIVGPWKIENGSITVSYGDPGASDDTLSIISGVLQTILTASEYIPVGASTHTSLHLGNISLDGEIPTSGLSSTNEYVETILSTISEWKK